MNPSKLNLEETINQLFAVYEWHIQEAAAKERGP